MRKAIITILAMALFTVVTAGTAFALLSGTIGWSGPFDPADQNFSNAGTFNLIQSPFGVSPYDIYQINVHTGDFTNTEDKIPQFLDTDGYELTYDPTMIIQPTLPEQDATAPNDFWWRVNDGSDDFEFRLTSFFIQSFTGATITFIGKGTLYRNGGEATPANWFLSANPGNYSTSAQAVPEPATMILIGTGLVGLVGTRIRRKK